MRTEGSVDLDKTLTATTLPSTFPFNGTKSHGHGGISASGEGTTRSTTGAGSTAGVHFGDVKGGGQGKIQSRFPRFPLPATDDLRAVPMRKTRSGGGVADGTAPVPEKQRTVEPKGGLFAEFLKPPLPLPNAIPTSSAELRTHTTSCR